MKIVNLTPHEIKIIASNTLTIPPSGAVARVKTEEKIIDELNGIPIVTNKLGNPIGLPEEPEENTIYIVSSIVAQAISQSPELRKKFEDKIYVPNTAPTPNGAVRDEKGRIIGVKSLVKPF